MDQKLATQRPCVANSSTFAPEDTAHAEMRRLILFGGTCQLAPFRAAPRRFQPPTIQSPRERACDDQHEEDKPASEVSAPHLSAPAVGNAGVHVHGDRLQLVHELHHQSTA
eukprot:12531326-Prorocentrum_lima.AAC.1